MFASEIAAGNKRQEMRLASGWPDIFWLGEPNYAFSEPSGSQTINLTKKVRLNESHFPYPIFRVNPISKSQKSASNCTSHTRSLEPILNSWSQTAPETANLTTSYVYIGYERANLATLAHMTGPQSGQRGSSFSKSNFTILTLPGVTRSVSF